MFQELGYMNMPNLIIFKCSHSLKPCLHQAITCNAPTRMYQHTSSMQEVVVVLVTAHQRLKEMERSTDVRGIQVPFSSCPTLICKWQMTQSCPSQEFE